MNYNYLKKDKKQDEFRIIMQWKILLEFLISMIKDDSSYYYELINYYENSISLKTKIDLFNEIRNNKYVMEDLKNVLKEKMINFII